MNTPQERHTAAKAIAAMRSKPAARAPRASRALDIDHYLDEVELQRLEDGECLEVPSYNLTEPNKINYNRDSIAGAIASKNNSHFSQGGRKNGK